MPLMAPSGMRPKRRPTIFRERSWARIIGGGILCLFYLVAIFADFLAPYDYRDQARHEPFVPPSFPHFVDEHGQWNTRPFIYARRLIAPLEGDYQADPQRAYRIEFFTFGYSYKLFGLIATNRHLFGVQQSKAATPRFNLLGTDALGRDRLSRLIHASRFSLLTGPLGAVLTSLLGGLIGCLAGYARHWAGNWVDAALMRVADVMIALPSLVMILAARAAFPLALPPERAALLLIGIFVALGWAEMARLSRGLVLELSAREFVTAAESIGMSPFRVLARHILPNAAGPLIVQTLLMLPAFFLSETALSFLGVGLQEPEASWGSMLASAADLSLLERKHAWVLLTPALIIMLFVLAARLLSAGLKSGRAD